MGGGDTPAACGGAREVSQSVSNRPPAGGNGRPGPALPLRAPPAAPAAPRRAEERRGGEGTHRLERFGRQPPSPQVPQGAAERAAGRLGLRLRSLVVDSAVLHSRAARRLPAGRKRKQKGGGGGRGEEGDGEGGGGPPRPWRDKGVSCSERHRSPRRRAGATAEGGVRGTAGSGRPGTGGAMPRGSRAGVASGLGLLSVL